MHHQFESIRPDRFKTLVGRRFCASPESPACRTHRLPSPQSGISGVSTPPAIWRVSICSLLSRRSSATWRCFGIGAESARAVGRWRHSMPAWRRRRSCWNGRSRGVAGEAIANHDGEVGRCAFSCHVLPSESRDADGQGTVNTLRCKLLKRQSFLEPRIRPVGLALSSESVLDAV